MKTFAIIKPDAVKAGNMGKILSFIEANGFRVEQMHMGHWDDPTTWEHFYAEHAGKPFYRGLVDFMKSGPCVVLMLERENAVQKWRDLMGPSDPTKAPKGTIRGAFGTVMPANAVHGSDSPQAAQRELDFFF